MPMLNILELKSYSQKDIRCSIIIATLKMINGNIVYLDSSWETILFMKKDLRSQSQIQSVIFQNLSESLQRKDGLNKKNARQKWNSFNGENGFDTEASCFVAERSHLLNRGTALFAWLSCLKLWNWKRDSFTFILCCLGSGISPCALISQKVAQQVGRDAGIVDMQSSGN